ncbi:MAG: hypothetical protein JW822_09615 [Spirochaetales bacterium]|nr:hypothetical protein [Spirochaetales bacterium]
MKAYASVIILLLLAVIFSCQDIFTYSPLDILERDPKTLSKEQQLLYAEQALSSGRRGVMIDALDVVVNELLPDDPTSVKLNLLVADLLWALSNAPIALQNYLFDNSNQFPDPGVPADFPLFVADLESRLNPPDDILALQTAAVYYWNVENILGGSLHAMQQLATGIGLLSIDPVANFAIATPYITNAINAMIP